MGYRSATLNADAAPSSTVMAALESEMTVVGWVFIEELVAGSYTVRVWKNPASLNSLHQDFYVLFARTTASLATSALYITAVEVWDTATKLFYRQTYATGSTTYTIEATYNSFDGATGKALTTLSWLMTTGAAFSPTMTYYLRVSPDSIMLAGTGLPRFIYAGLFQPFWPSDVFPLFVGNPAVAAGSNSVQDGATTRRPKVSGTALSYQLSTVFSCNTASAYETFLGYMPASSAAPSEGVVRGARVMLQGGTSIPNYSTLGDTGQRGLLDGLLIFRIMSSVVLYDTITVDGVSYVCVMRDTGGNYAIFMRQAV